MLRRRILQAASVPISATATGAADPAPALARTGLSIPAMAPVAAGLLLVLGVVLTVAATLRRRRTSGAGCSRP